MNKRDPLKGKVIARAMAQTGCSFEMAEAAYAEHVEKRLLLPMMTIVLGMAFRKAWREVMGHDFPQCN